jgi:lipoyl(octanoyl) transferase
MSELRILNQLGKLTDYESAWEQQRVIHSEVVDGAQPSSVLFVEHPSIFTAGKRTQMSDRPVDGSRVVEVDRGGRITWHGPGQLVGYPIIKLPDPVDVMDYVHRIEAAIIDVCQDFGIQTIRVESRTGVWVPGSGVGQERKIAAIGVRVAKGVTMHGFSLNCNPDLAEYSRIVPCGIEDAGVTSISQELGREVTIQEVSAQVMAAINKQLLGWAL